MKRTGEQLVSQELLRTKSRTNCGSGAQFRKRSAGQDRLALSWGQFWGILRYLRGFERQIATILLLTMVTTGLSVLQPWPLKVLLDYALSDAALPAWLAAVLEAASLSGPLETALFAAAAVVAIYSFGAVVTYVTGSMSASVGQRATYRVARAIIDAAQRRSLLHQNRQSVSDLLNTLTGDSWSVYTVFSAGLVAPVQLVLGAVGMGAVMFALDPGLGALILVLTPPAAVLNYLLTERLVAREVAQRKLQSRLWDLVRGTLTHFRFIKASQLEAHNAQRLRALQAEAEDIARARAHLSQQREAVNVLSLAATVALVLYFGAFRVVEGDLLIGSLVIAIAYARRLHALFKSALESYGKLRSASVSVARITDALRPDAAIPEPAVPDHLPADAVRAGLAISFCDVGFCFSPQAPVLRGVSLDVAAGERIAIVGPSGAGKTTLVSLLARFADVDSGAVKIAGKDIRTLKISSLRERISFVLQNFLVFPGTVEENIRLGRIDASVEELAAAVASARLRDIIDRLPEGLATRIGDDGIRLSRGELQRIAIARALLKKSGIIVFDEPLASIDRETRDWLINEWNLIFREQTILIITHDTSVRGLVDRVCHLRDGAIVSCEAGARATAGKVPS